jgi:hypothetical protein
LYTFFDDLLSCTFVTFLDDCYRSLFTKILIPTSLMGPGCESLIEEELPAGLYIDPYELKNYREQGGPQVRGSVTRGTTLMVT